MDLGASAYVVATYRYVNRADLVGLFPLPLRSVSRQRWLALRVAAPAWLAAVAGTLLG